MYGNSTIPDTYAESHIDNTLTKPGTAAHKAAQDNSCSFIWHNAVSRFYLLKIMRSFPWKEHRRRHPGSLEFCEAILLLLIKLHSTVRIGFMDDVTFSSNLRTVEKGIVTTIESISETARSHR